MKKINMKKLFSSLFITIISQFCFSQTTWYVSNSGSNANTGLSSSNPFKDINQALSLASCGDSLYISSGTYYEKIQATTLCPENNRIVIQGDIAQKPLIIGDSIPTNKYAVSANGSGYYFRNLRMTSPYPYQCSQSNQVIVGSGDYFTFDDIVVFNSGYDGIKTYGDCNTNDFAVNWKIINSEIYNCGLGCPASIVNGDGIDFTQCRNCSIENSIVRDNMGHQLQIKLEAKNVNVVNSHFEGRHLFQIGLPGAVAQCDPTNFNADSVNFSGNTIIAKGDTSEFVFKLADVSHLTIHNNTIIKDSIGSINVGFICFGGCTGASSWTNTPTAPVSIKSNIFANYSSTIFEYGVDTIFFDPFNVFGTAITADYNLFYDLNGQITTSIDNGANSIVANPLFCDYPVSFELQSGSPCINNGDPNLPLDPDNSQNDIGAKYYHNLCTTNAVNERDITVKSLQFYPNPLEGELYIESKMVGTLVILNSIGQVVHYQEITVGLNQLNLHKLPKGLYVTMFENEHRLVTEVEKIIIN